MLSLHFKRIQDMENLLASASSPAERLNILQDLAWACYFRAIPRAQDWMKQANQLLSSFPHNPAAHARQMLLEASDLYYYGTSISRVLEMAYQVAAECEKIGDEQWLVRAQSTIVNIYLTQGQYTAARELAEVILATGRRLNNPELISIVINLMGSIQLNTGDVEGGLNYLQQSIALATEHDIYFVQFLGWNHISRGYLRLGRYDDALDAIKRCFALAVQMQLLSLAPMSYLALSDIYMQLNDFPQALQAVQRGLASLPPAYTTDRVKFDIKLGIIYTRTHRYNLALQMLTSALNAAETNQMWRHAITCHEQLITLYKALGHPEPLIHHYDQLIALQKRVFDEESDQRLKTLEVMHRTQQAQAEADSQRQFREVDRDHFERITRIKDDIIQGVSHDLKSPLSSMDVLLTFLTRQVNGDQKSLEYIERLRHSMFNMRSLITDVLDLAQIETGYTLEQRPVAAGAFVREIVQQYKPEALSKNISLTFDAARSEAMAWFDSSQIRRVITNLISNAIKYTPDNGAIEVEVVQNEETIVIRVTDNGSGIAPDDLPHIFERFYRVKNGYQAEQEGTGLGLSIARSIVEKHGGEIWVESEVDKGSVFSFSLPLALARAM